MHRAGTGGRLMNRSLLSVALIGSLAFAATGNLQQAKAAASVSPSDLARQKIGEKYTWGSNDCSGFTQKVFAQLGVRLPRTAAAQAGYGTPVSKDDLQPGDLVFFHTYKKGISHVGIYVGNNQMISAESEKTGVRQTQIFNGGASVYWAPRFVTARRVIARNQQTVKKTPVQAVSHQKSSTSAVAHGANTNSEKTQTFTAASQSSNKNTKAEMSVQKSPKSEKTAVSDTSSRDTKTAAPAVRKASAKRIAADGKTYIVRAGDSLWAISRNHGINVSLIQKINHLDSSLIYPGQKLNLQEKAKTYTIKKGDTLWDIARTKGTTVKQLMKVNHLSSAMIFPGKELTLPKN